MTKYSKEEIENILSKNKFEYQKIDLPYNLSTPGNNSDSNILPIFGKPLYRGSSNWLYYTSSDKNTSIKMWSPQSYKFKIF